MAVHPAAIKQVLRPFRVALTGGRSKTFISDTEDSSATGSKVGSGAERIKAPKKRSIARRKPKRKREQASVAAALQFCVLGFASVNSKTKTQNPKPLPY